MDYNGIFSPQKPHGRDAYIVIVLNLSRYQEPTIVWSQDIGLQCK